MSQDVVTQLRLALDFKKCEVFLVHVFLILHTVCIPLLCCNYFVNCNKALRSAMRAHGQATTHLKQRSSVDLKCCEFRNRVTSRIFQKVTNTMVKK